MSYISQFLNYRANEEVVYAVSRAARHKWKELGEALYYHEYELADIIESHRLKECEEARKEIEEFSDKKKLRVILNDWCYRLKDKATVGKLLDACADEDVKMKAEVVSKLVKVAINWS